MPKRFNQNTLDRVRDFGRRFVDASRNIQAPAVPTKIKRQDAPQKRIFARPTKSRRTQDFNRYQDWKKKLMERYDTNEYVRRENLTITQHSSHTGKIGSQGFRRYSTVKGIPYFRDKSPHQKHENVVRQYAAQYETEFDKKYYHSAEQDVFRNKRDDGERPLSAYRFKKKQLVESKVKTT